MLGKKTWNGNVKAGIKSERAEQELEGKLPPFFTYFFLFMVFFFFTWKEKDAKRKHLKWKCKNRKAEARAKSERVEWELEGKLPPFFWSFFCCFLVCFVFFVFEKKKKKMTLWPSFLCLRRRWWHNNMLLSFSLVVLRFNLVVFGCLYGSRHNKGRVCCKYSLGWNTTLPFVHCSSCNKGCKCSSFLLS